MQTALYVLNNSLTRNIKESLNFIGRVYRKLPSNKTILDYNSRANEAFVTHNNDEHIEYSGKVCNEWQKLKIWAAKNLPPLEHTMVHLLYYVPYTSKMSAFKGPGDVDDRYINQLHKVNDDLTTLLSYDYCLMGGSSYDVDPCTIDNIFDHASDPDVRLYAIFIDAKLRMINGLKDREVRSLDVFRKEIEILYETVIRLNRNSYVEEELTYIMHKYYNKTQDEYRASIRRLNKFGRGSYLNGLLNKYYMEQKFLQKHRHTDARYSLLKHYESHVLNYFINACHKGHYDSACYVGNYYYLNNEIERAKIYYSMFVEQNYLTNSHPITKENMLNSVHMLAQLYNCSAMDDLGKFLQLSHKEQQKRLVMGLNAINHHGNDGREFAVSMLEVLI